MKTNQTGIFTTALLLAALAPFALAQPAATATGAANTAANASRVTSIAQNAPGSSATNNAAMSAASAGQNAASSAVNAASNAGATAAANSSATIAGGVASTTGTVGANGSLTGSVAADASRPGAVVSANPALNSAADANLRDNNINSSINAGDSFAVDTRATRATTNEIRSTTFETRDDIAGSIEGRLEAANESLAYLRGRSGEIGSAAHNQFQRAVNVARQQEIQVRASLRAVRMASRDKFDDARDQLASDYAAYLSAAARAEAAGQASVGASK